MAGEPDGTPHAVPSLDPGTLEVIRWSAHQLSGIEELFIERLHSDLSALIPGMAANGRAVSERIVRSLLWAALANQPPKVIADALQGVGASNWQDGFPDAQYANVANALVRVVRNLSGSDQFASIGSAWVSYFLCAQPYLIAGARLAAAQQAAADRAAAEQAAARREAAQQEAARARTLALYRAGPHRDAVGEVNLEKVADLLDDEDEDEAGEPSYGQIMLSMTPGRRRDRPHRHD